MYRRGLSSPLRRGAGISGPTKMIIFVGDRPAGWSSRGLILSRPYFLSVWVWGAILTISLCHPVTFFFLSSWGLTPGSRYINLFASANSNLICVVYKIYGHHKFVRALRGILITWAPWSSHGVTNFCRLWFNHAMTMGIKYPIPHSLTTPPCGPPSNGGVPAYRAPRK